MKKLDDVLFNALSPNYEPDEELNHRIIDYEKENKMGEIKNIWRKSFPAAAAVVAAVMITSVTTFAAWRYLTAKDVAERVDDRKLAEAFTEEDAWNEAEVQSYGGYDISLIGLVSGTDISDYLSIQNGKVVADKTYAVVAISNADGTPMPDTSDAEYGKQDFLVSPYIEGRNPAFVNIFSLGGGAARGRRRVVPFRRRAGLAPLFRLGSRARPRLYRDLRDSVGVLAVQRGAVVPVAGGGDGDSND